MKNYSYDGNTINLTNSTPDTMPGGAVVDLGNGWFAIPVADIPSGGYGAAAQCGAFKFSVPSTVTLDAAADFTYDIATQEYSATAAVIGRVMEQTGNTVHVLLNSMSGGVR